MPRSLHVQLGISTNYPRQHFVCLRLYFWPPPTPLLLQMRSPPGNRKEGPYCIPSSISTSRLHHLPYSTPSPLCDGDRSLIFLEILCSSNVFAVCLSIWDSPCQGLGYWGFFSSSFVINLTILGDILPKITESSMSVHCQKIVLVRGHVAETHFDSYLSQKQHRLFRGPTLFATGWEGIEILLTGERNPTSLPSWCQCHGWN